MLFILDWCVIKGSQLSFDLMPQILCAYKVVDVELLQGSLNCSETKYGGLSKNEHGVYPGNYNQFVC